MTVADLFARQNILNTKCTMKIKVMALFGFAIALCIVHKGLSADAPLSRQQLEANLNATVVKASSQFALDLYKELGVNGEDNVFFSPYSVTVALAMTLLGTRGRTREELLDGLRYRNIAESDIHDSLSSLIQMMQSNNAQYTLKTANKLFVQKDYEILKEFLTSTQKYYLAIAESVNFKADPKGARKSINEWVENQTAKKIKDLIAEGVLNPLVRLVLVNAIYFKGDWKDKFDLELTHSDKFFISKHQYVNVDMMRKKGKFAVGYDSGLGADVLAMPYAGGDIKFVAVLPRDGTNLADVERDITAETLNRLCNDGHTSEVEVALPKFKLLENYDLHDILPTFGIKDLFDENKADLSGINGGFERLFVSKVLHKAFLEVNEEGSEAAAASAVIILAKSAMLENRMFIANKPFLFCIYDSKSKAILFLGRLVKPEGQVVDTKEL